MKNGGNAKKMYGGKTNRKKADMLPREMGGNEGEEGGNSVPCKLVVTPGTEVLREFEVKREEREGEEEKRGKRKSVPKKNAGGGKTPRKPRKKKAEGQGGRRSSKKTKKSDEQPNELEAVSEFMKKVWKGKKSQIREIQKDEVRLRWILLEMQEDFHRKKSGEVSGE